MQLHNFIYANVMGWIPVGNFSLSHTRDMTNITVYIFLMSFLSLKFAVFINFNITIQYSFIVSGPSSMQDASHT